MADHLRQTIIKDPLDLEKESVAQRWLFRAFLALLLWVPLPLGSNRLWSWGMMECLIAIMLAVWAGIRLIEYKRDNKVWSPDPAITQYRSAILLLFLGTLYPLWQTIPWPEPLLAFISPTTLMLRQLSGIADSAGSISLDIHATLAEWLKGMAYLGAFWLALTLTVSRKHFKQLAWVLLGSGALQVAVNLWNIDPNPAHQVKGTFVNRNHLAGFLELLLPVSMGLLLHWRRKSGLTQSWRENIHGWLSFISGPKGVVAGLGIAQILVLFLTQSRGGNASLLLSLLVMAGLYRWRRHLFLNRMSHRKQHKRKSNNVLARFLSRFLLLGMLLSVGIWIGLGHLMGRYMTTNLYQAERWVVFTTASGIVADYPLFGSGSGTFAFIYPRYQNEKLSDAFYNHAHNDHLEILADRGIVGYGLLAAGVSIGWFGIARAYLRRRDPYASALLFASLAATLSLILHGMIDFNFQIPSNALYFMVLLAMGLRGSVVRPAKRDALC